MSSNVVELPNRSTPEPYVSLAEAAAHLGVKRSWLYNCAERHGVPRFRVGNTYRFRLSELDAWMEEQRSA